MELDLTMKKLLIAIVFCFVGSGAWAQCNGIFPANTLCGNLSGSPRPPGAFSSAGTVAGPASSTSGSVVVWGNSVGTLLSNSNLASGFFVNTSITSIFDTNLSGGMQFGFDWTRNTSIYVPPGFGIGGSTFNLAQITVFNNPTTGAGQNGGLFLATDRTAGNGSATLALNSYCFAENANGRGCWNYYAEGHRIGTSDYVLALGEFAVTNRLSTVIDVTPANITNAFGTAVGATFDCGNSQPTSIYIEYSCTAGVTFQGNWGTGQNSTNNLGFLHGIVFRANALDTSVYNPAEAISLNTSPRQAVSFWNSGGTSRSWLVYSDDAAQTGGPKSLNFSSTGIINSSHLSNGGGAPVSSGCTGFSLSSGSTDSNGSVTFNSALTCAMSFNVAYHTTPFCNVTPQASLSTVLVSPTASGFTATFGTSQTAMSWHCAGF